MNRMVGRVVVVAGVVAVRRIAARQLDDGPRGYDLFKHKNDGCVRAVFRPSA
jgi:hypothetical protein